jgi:hypothetical protein
LFEVSIYEKEILPHTVLKRSYIHVFKVDFGVQVLYSKCWNIGRNKEKGGDVAGLRKDERDGAGRRLNDIYDKPL